MLNGFCGRLERLEHLAVRFNHKASNLEAWMDGKDKKLSQREDLQTASLAEAMASTLPHTQCNIPSLYLTL